jgi:hypothetical protein
MAGPSKIVFIALVLAEGDRYLGQQVGLAIADGCGDGCVVRVVSGCEPPTSTGGSLRCSELKTASVALT